MFSIKTLLAPVLLASYAAAHGMVHQVTVNGVTDTGRIPGNGGGRDSAIRQISTQDPNYGANNPALTCGPNARRAANVLDVNPGDTMSFKWTTANPNQVWPHNTGPIMTYLASCGEQSCADFDASNARFFKIHQAGARNGRWAQADLMNGAPATAQIPANLAPGNYLVRHEIIALHLANNGPRQAEFYPSCTQIRVGGSGAGRPLDSELVSIPGAYDDNHRGLYRYDSNNYQFPGPAVAAFVNGGPSGGAPSTGGGNGGSGNNNGNGNGNGNANDEGAPSSTKKQASSTAAGDAPSATAVNNGAAGSSKPKQKCKATRRSVDKTVYPRHFSRIMRRALKSGALAPASH